MLTLTSASRPVTIGTHYSYEYEMEEITIAHMRANMLAIPTPVPRT
jgi:hypothetical protein